MLASTSTAVSSLERASPAAARASLCPKRSQSNRACTQAEPQQPHLPAPGTKSERPRARLPDAGAEHERPRACLPMVGACLATAGLAVRASSATKAAARWSSPVVGMAMQASLHRTPRQRRSPALSWGPLIPHRPLVSEGWEDPPFIGIFVKYFLVKYPLSQQLSLNQTAPKRGQSYLIQAAAIGCRGLLPTRDFQICRDSIQAEGLWSVCNVGISHVSVYFHRKNTKTGKFSRVSNMALFVCMCTRVCGQLFIYLMEPTRDS